MKTAETAEILAGLDDVDWAKLNHAYGDVADVPDMLRGLLSDDAEQRDLGLDGIWGAVHHQGDIYDSTIAALPFLIRMAVAPEFAVRVGVLEVLESIAEMPSGDAHALIAASVPSYVPLLTDADSDVRRAAATLLARFPDERALIFPAVRDAIARSGTQPLELAALLDAAAGFVGTGEQSTAEVDAWLVNLWEQSSDSASRLSILSRIAGRGPDAFPGDLVSAVCAEVDGVFASTQASESTAPPVDAPASHPTLVAALRTMRAEAEAGQSAPWVGPLLDDVHRSLDARVADRAALAAHELRAAQWERRYNGTRMAHWILTRYRGDHAELVRLVGRQLADPEARVCSMAESTLQNLGDISAPAVEAFAAVVAEGSDAWQNRLDMSGAVVALAKLGDARALPALRWNATRPQLPPSFASAVGGLGPLGREFAPLLASLLKKPGPDRGWDTRTSYCAALGALGPGAASAVPTLLKALDDARLTSFAVVALAKIAPDEPKVRKACARIAKHEKPGCVTAARVLAAANPTSELASLLVRHLDDSGRTGLEAATALALFPASQIRLGPEIHGRAAESDNSWERLTAAIALHHATGDVATAISALTWAWDTNPSIRAEVARYLPKLGAAGFAAFEGRLRDELADPTRHRFRQFTSGGGLNDVVDDEELLSLCRIAIETGNGSARGEHH